MTLTGSPVPRARETSCKDWTHRDRANQVQAQFWDEGRQAILSLLKQFWGNVHIHFFTDLNCLYLHGFLPSIAQVPLVRHYNFIGTIFTLPQVRRELMISDEMGRQLHNRSTLGEQLTNLEKEQLDAWYAKLDAIESKLLGDNADSQITIAFNAVAKQKKLVC